MKKRIICFVTAIILMLSASVNVCAADMTNNNGSINESDQYNLNMGDSGLSDIQLMYSRLLLELSENARKQAIGNMALVAEVQEEQKLVSNFLSTARQLQSESKENQNQTSRMPDDMYAYLNENDLIYDKTGDVMNYTAEEWETVIGLLENRLEELSIETQRLMILIQDFIGQYNSYLQGANTQIANSGQTLTNLARNQSMYGDSESGLAIAALVVGLALGCVITLVVQKVRRKKSVE